METEVSGSFSGGSLNGLCVVDYYFANQKITGHHKNGQPHGYTFTEYGNGNNRYVNCEDGKMKPGSNMMIYKLEGLRGEGTYFGKVGQDGMTITYDHSKFISKFNEPKEVSDL